jgi:[acyl-carrier-protein] S-malonyltransferase
VSGSTTALLLPGQGSQFVGMGRDLADRFDVARRTFEEADDALGFSLSGICWNGPEEELVRTRIAQPAILTHSIAVWRLVGERFADVALAAGHSLGEFSAYVVAGSLEFTDAVRLVRRRGEVMYEAGRARRGAMAAVLGLGDDALAEICERVSDEGSVVVPANFNSPGQVVISGDAEAVERAGVAARDAGAKRVLPLNVSGAFHSPLMEPAVAGFAQALDSTPVAAPGFPVVSNVTARANDDADEARRLLLRQLTSAVRWSDSVRSISEAGVTRMVELGPGGVLSNLVRRIARGTETTTLGTAEQVERFLSDGA